MKNTSNAVIAVVFGHVVEKLVMRKVLLKYHK